MAQHVCEDQGITCSWFSFSVWVSGIEHRSLSLAETLLLAEPSQQKLILLIECLCPRSKDA